MSLADPASQLPRSDETWQIARIHLPLWIGPDEGVPFRPWCVVVLRPPDGVFVQDPDEGNEPPSADEVAETVVEAARQSGLLPRRLLVAEDGLADDLRRHLTELDVEIEQVDSLPELSEALDSRVQPFFRDDPGLLAGEGVTLEQLASFAAAAAAFARAEPWRHLNGEDRINIESPEASPVRFALILGAHVPTRGALFLPEPPEEGDAPELHDPWLILYLPPWIVPTQDLYAWERHGLALAGEDNHPMVSKTSDNKRRPDAGLLDVFEAFLRAIAATTEDEMDSGRWEKVVETGRGPVRLVLSLPDLLHPAEPGFRDDEEDLFAEVWSEEDFEAASPEPPEAPDSPQRAARDLVNQAWKAQGRRRVVLARQALALWPDCVDAWVLLARRERDPERSVSLYSRAVEAAERALDPLFFETQAGNAWEVPEARPYMRVRFDLAESLWDAGRCEEAVDGFQELLRLNPMDNQGARFRLVDALILLDRDAEAARILDAYPEELLAHTFYVRVLLAFRREGDSPGARNCLTLALRRNRFIPKYLLMEDLLLEEAPPPFFRPGERSEAVVYAVKAQEVWEATPGALGWLHERTSTRGTRRKSRKGGKSGKKKRKGRR
jgi:tetratricopeptide (TPR) repeat protein